MQQAADDEAGAAADGPPTAEALHSEALQELAAVQAAATAAMVETTEMRRRNESLEAEVISAVASVTAMNGQLDDQALSHIQNNTRTLLHPCLCSMRVAVLARCRCGT